MNKSLLIFILLSVSIKINADQNLLKCDADTVNVRKEANINSQVITVIKNGEKVRLIERSKESILIDFAKAKWYKIETKDKKIGWVFSAYLSSVNGESIPFGIKNISGEWLIDDNDGIGAVKFIFNKNGSLIIKGEKSNSFDAECKWTYYSDNDSIKIIFNAEEWKERLSRLKTGNYSSKESYLLIDNKNNTLIVKITRNYYNDKKMVFELIEFPFFGYNVAKQIK